jgi:hypothetical protein
MTKAEEHQCAQCALRTRAEAKPNSLLAVLWRLHIKICPQWRSYQRLLAEEAGT